MRSKQTLFLTASAAAMAVALGGCKEEAKKDPNRRFNSVAECETFYGQPCVEENVPYKLTAKSSPMFLSRAACEAAFGADNCASTTVFSAQNRSTMLPENSDVDISDPLWKDRVEDLTTSPTTISPETVLWYPIRRDTASGGSYAYTGNNGHGTRYYGGGPHFTYFPIFMNSGGGGGYARPFVASNSARSAMGVQQTPSAGAPASNVGKAAAPSGSSSSIGKGSSGPSSGSIGSGASGKAGGFGSTGSGGGSSS